MPLAERVDDRIVLDQIEYRDHDLLKMLPGSKLDPVTRQWGFPLSWTACFALRGLYADRLTLGPALTAWGFAEKHAWVDHARELTSTLELPPRTEDDRLYGFQRVGVEWMHTVRHGILADEMGTGKTVQVCSYLDELSL